MMSEHPEEVAELLRLVQELNAQLDVYEELIRFLHVNVGDTADWPLTVLSDNRETYEALVLRANACFKQMGLTRSDDGKTDTTDDIQ